MQTVKPEQAQEMLNFFNAVSDVKGIKNRIKDYRTYILKSTKAYGIRKSIAQGLLDLRSTLPGSKFTDTNQILNFPGIGKDTRRDIIDSFTEENVPVFPDDIQRRNPFVMGRTYTFVMPRVRLPKFTYGIFFEGSQENEFGFKDSFGSANRLNETSDRIADLVVRTKIPHHIHTGAYQLITSGDPDIAISYRIEVVFEASVVELQSDNLIALRTVIRPDAMNPGLQQTLVGVLQGTEIPEEKEGMIVKKRGMISTSLKGIIPGSNEPEFVITNPASPFTDFQFAKLRKSDSCELVCISGRSQSSPRDLLNPIVQIRDTESGKILKLGKMNEIVLAARSTPGGAPAPDMGPVVQVRSDENGLDYIGIGPQLSFLVENETGGVDFSVSSADVFFIGKYGKKLNKKVVSVPSGTSGATLQRGGAAVAAINPSETLRKQLIFFCKNILVILDFAGEKIKPALIRYYQVDDPFAQVVSGSTDLEKAISAAQHSNIANDVENPIRFGNTEPLNATTILNRPNGFTNAQGRRYGLFRMVNIDNQEGAVPNLILAGHSMPKKGDYFSIFTTYPSFDKRFPNPSYPKPLWRLNFKNNSDDDPGLKIINNDPSCGSETYCYRFFKEASKKADKKDGAPRFTFINDKLLVGGTPPNGISDLGDNRICMIISDAPEKLDKKRPRVYIIDAKTGLNRAVLDNAVALDVSLKLSNGRKALIVWEGNNNQPYENFHLAAYEILFDEDTSKIKDDIILQRIPFDFGTQQPFLLSINDLDTAFDPEIAPSGRLDLLLPELLAGAPLNGQILITFTVLEDDTASSLDEQIQYINLYTLDGTPGENSSLKLLHAAIPIGGPNEKLKTVSTSIPSAMEVEKRIRISSELEGTGIDTSLDQITFVVEETNPNGNKLRFKRIGQSNGEIGLVAACVISVNEFSA